MASTAGIFAPTLRHHNGVFYIISTLVTNRAGNEPKENFIVTAKNPAGPWSNPHWIEGAEGIDPSLFLMIMEKFTIVEMEDPRTWWTSIIGTSGFRN